MALIGGELVELRGANSVLGSIFAVAETSAQNVLPLRLVVAHFRIIVELAPNRCIRVGDTKIDTLRVNAFD